MMWTEKYRPETMKDVVGHMEQTPIWNKWVNEKDMPHVILSGQQGIGKTTIAIALARDILGEAFALNFLELNASDDRKLETVRTRIKDFASTVKLGNCPFKICLLDEMDGMTKDAQNALKRIMEKYSNNIRFIITCNDNSKIIAPIQSRCATYQFSKLDDKHIFMALNRILKIEKGEEIPTTVWMNQAYAFNGDLRKAITQMQAGFDSIIEIIDPMFEEIMIDSINNMCVLDKLHKLLSKGISTKDICNGLHDVILESRMDREIKYKYLRIIGETEYRSSTMTPKIIISWLATQMK